MNDPMQVRRISRRHFFRASSTLAAAALAGQASNPIQAANAPTPAGTEDAGPWRALLTPADKFRDVSRGDPKPHTLKGDALVQARLTAETWRLEITADTTIDPAIKDRPSLSRPLTLADGTALDLPALLELGKKHEAKFLKAMQCLNIPTPLGQGLWEGVPLRDVLRHCGTMRNVRRIYYWGFHNNDPKQRFQSSVSYTQAMETAPGELPAFLAYRLNGAPIPLARGGPVRMVIPWAHGFKSIKWLQHIVVTNDYKSNDTYAEQNNDPESHLKTAAYLDELPATIASGRLIAIGGQVISGLSGLQRVEYLLERDGEPSVSEDARSWVEGRMEEPPTDWTRVLPPGVTSRQVLGFNPKTGQPATWPLRYSMISWSATLKGLARGKYSVRARAVDLNGFAQPEPRPNQKAGINAPEVREFEVI